MTVSGRKSGAIRGIQTMAHRKWRALHGQVNKEAG